MAWLGGVMPYFALELQARGVVGWAFTLAVVAVPATRLLIGPLWGLLADHLQDERLVLNLSGVLLLLGTLAVWKVAPPLLPAAALLLALGLVGVGPMVDALALKAYGDRYGFIRAWGSIGFLLMVFGSGVAADRLGISPFALGIALCVALLLVTVQLPRVAPSPRVPLLPAVRSVLARPGMAWLLLASGLHFSGHAAYDSFFAIHVESLGLGQSWTGAVMATGVVVETVLMLLGRSLIIRFGARRMLLFSLALAIPRWWLTGTVTDAHLNVALQVSHGVTFGVFWLAAVALVDRGVPTVVKTSALALLSAAVGGFGALLGALGGGILLPHVGTMGVYRAATLTAVLALLAALKTPRAEA